MSLKPNTLSITKIFLWLTLWILLALLSAPLMAETDNKRISTTISFDKQSEPDREARDLKLKQTDADITTELNTQGFRIESTAKALTIVSTDNYFNDFVLYDAATELISDINYDGYYHRFSINIDIDTVYDVAFVYTKLYLSYEGGPWNYYATSDDYHIYGDSELDSLVIETELADGFPSGYYDIRIEVYDADSGNWLLSYGPYDDASLSSLPLQDAYLDDSIIVTNPVEAEIVVVGGVHSGSMSGWLLLIPGLLAAMRLTAGKSRS